jgi:glycosyltransferase involved in cell wall biosynthesis
MLVSADCMRAVQRLDESFFLYSEETELAWRVRAAGFGIWFEPSAVVPHTGGDSNTSADLWSLLTLNRVRYYSQRHTRVATASFAVAVGVNEAVRAAGGSSTHRAALGCLLSPSRRQALLARLRGRTDSGRGDGVVCFSAQDYWYHNRAHSDIQLLRRVSETRPVLFVNSIGMRMPLPGRSSQPVRRVMRKVASIARYVRRPEPGLPGFVVMSPVIVPFYGIPFFRRLNRRLVTTQVRRVMHRVGMQRPACIVTLPTAAPVAGALKLRPLVYNRSDRHSDFTEADQRYVRELETGLLRQSDVVLYVSHALMDADRDKIRTGRQKFLDHGVDLDLFAPDEHDEPADLAHIPHPRIGFFGGLDDYVVDFALLETLARRLPEAQLVLVGDATCSMDQLTTLSNVHWLGRRPYELIPRYGTGFDVAWMPWLRNDWIEVCNPIKLKEYLALGLPVVSTNFPEVRRYSDVVRIADSADDFVELVAKSLADGGLATPDARRTRVLADTWSRRARELTDLIDSAGEL